ncbi:IS21 family transposase [Georgenia sp. MJ206]|uniref:IS21 family transposase n=1 Tax=Georgenia wangjunii TaxID=3117730 RepID=UPI002F25EFC1
MMTVEDWAEIRRLHRVEGLAIKAIGRRLGVSRNAVRRALARDAPPKYVRAPKGSIVDAVEPAIRELLREHPRMPATVIAERIGWDRSLTVLKDRVRELRPYYLPPDPATRTAYDPGQRVQCDLWFPPVQVPLGFAQSGSPPVLVMVSGYSRMIFARMLPTRQAPDLIAGHWALLQAMGGVPAQLVWDNEPAVGSWRAGKPRLSEEFEAFRGTLGISVHQCRPRDPESKGLVERANGYLETSFLPGRTFTGPADFNTQLTQWLVRANARHHRSLGARPVDRWGADLAAMLALPPLAPQIGWATTVRLPRDHYVRLDSNDYSVDPAAVGRKVVVSADLETVTVRLGTRVLATHERCWARQQSITDPAHRAAALALAHAAAHRPPAQPLDAVEQRDLSTYDTAFGLTEVA